VALLPLYPPLMTINKITLVSNEIYIKSFSGDLRFISDPMISII
jgi:hypothetical protein